MAQSRFNKKGFSLVEVLLASALLSILLFGFVGAYLYGQEATITSGKRAQAVFLAQQGLEAARNIRDANFTNIAAGTYGIARTGNVWVFSGTQDVTGIYTRKVVITSTGSSRFQVASTVTWNQNLQRTGTVTLTSTLTNWAKVCTGTSMADGITYSGNGFLSNGTTDLSNVVINNTGTCPATIDKVNIVWTALNRTMQTVQLGGTTVFTGNVASGVNAEIADTTIAAAGSTSTLFHFSGSMLLSSFIITVTMSDGSTKSSIPILISI